MKAVLVLLAMVAVDVFWAKYTLATAAHQPLRAGLWSVAILIGGAFTVLQYTDNHWMLVPAALGGFLGTFYAVSREKRNAKSAG